MRKYIIIAVLIIGVAITIWMITRAKKDEETLRNAQRKLANGNLRVVHKAPTKAVASKSPALIKKGRS